MLTQQEHEKLQNVQLELMDEIHRICEKYQITYYMIAGTLIGAVRHKGFIPWDIDMDIAMMRDDYEKFKIACESENSDQYIYMDYLAAKNYTSPHALFGKKNTHVRFKLDRCNPERECNEIAIDIFPLDNAPDDLAYRKKQAQRLLNLRKFKAYRLPYSYSLHQWKRTAHYIISAILSFVSVKKLNRYEQRVMQWHRNENTACVCSMASQYAYQKQCMPREFYGKPVLLEFEGRRYYAPKRYEDCLSHLYGDYMKLPSAQQQQESFARYDSVEM